MKLLVSLLSGLGMGIIVWGTLRIRFNKLRRYDDESTQVYDNMFFVLISLAAFSFGSFLVYLILIYI